MNIMHNRSKQAQRAKEAGFTLLLAALVASITLALGAAIYSIAIKQVELAGIGRDSQFAFYTADSLAECVLYWDLRYNLFSTSTLPTSITCNNVVAPVDAVSDSNTFQPGTCTFYSAYTTGSSNCSGTTFTVPNNTTQVDVVAYGAGGSGGGGADPGNDGGNGKNGTGDTTFLGLVAGPGGFGPGGSLSGSGSAPTGQKGAASGGTTNTAGGASTGGAGGSGYQQNGGYGGNGGYVSKSYPIASLPAPGSTISVTIGSGGTPGGAPGDPAYDSAGSLGRSGSIVLSWPGQAGSWTKTTFSFHMDFNGDCAYVTYVKELNGTGGVSGTINADGFNVPCSATSTDPHALERSVEWQLAL